ncbi:GMC oxidoreductase [Purpureocillium lavendulum]|uniref:GMC oxidoreductase n=1 Tax=Purpureocillium lavendulum TaxID=1247861 RepID=A0AB34FG54_9HYPO|nr:GMC oxidoreductase [Purpureocillium lavendulum]
MRSFKSGLSATLLLSLGFASAAPSDSFDYVVVGAGTSGLVIANRLSEDPSVSVAIIDPGPDERDNPLVQNPAAWTSLLNTSVNWRYQTIPQVNASNRIIEFDAGKGIGGTSLINGMTYIRGDKAQFDAWEKLGATGWNWETLLLHYKKVEKFFAPLPWQIEVGASVKEEFHGHHGQLRVGFTPVLQNGSFYHDSKVTWEGLGQALNPDVNGGTTRGFDVWPQTLDPEQNLRWDSARAFLWPIIGRKNLHLINGTVSRVLWKSGRHGHDDAQVDAVEYLANPGNTRKKVNINREAVISAGALRTPLILERSGIGNPKVLKSMGIKPVVSLPGVGENLIDQPNIALIYASKAEHNGTSPYATFATARDLFGDRTEEVAAQTQQELKQWAKVAAAQSNGSLDVRALEHIFQVQHDLIFIQNVTVAETLTTAAQSIAVSAFWPLLPFSRGSVHIRSKRDEHIAEPVIDPKYLSNAFDAATYIAAGRQATDFWRRHPISATVAGQITPNSTTLPENASDTQWLRWLQDSIGSNSHSIGTCSLASRELGGVVDPNLRVYGTSGLRIMDASVLPMQISGHLSSTLYAMSDRLAELMK